MVAPIHLSTTFERDVEGTYSRGFMYTRNDNPNRKALEEGVSLLEGGAAAAASSVAKLFAQTGLTPTAGQDAWLPPQAGSLCLYRRLSDSGRGFDLTTRGSKRK